jgi:predicted RNA-binding Zn-ribbon protein involved in translation (DUF1610 family)
MGLVKCHECECDLTPTNFHEVERVKTGEEICLCTQCYNSLLKEGRLEKIDEDGNRTCGNLHIYRGTNTEIKPWPYPCPECGSATYLGVFIPTVAAFWADYYGWSFRCHNLNCAPVYEKHEIDWDKNGDECEPRIVYDLVDCGAYWDDEDDCYYTPQAPRL